LVAIPRLVRVAKAAQIYTNATVAMLRELRKLILEHLVVDWPAMNENNRLSSPNIFNTNIDSTDRFDLVTQL
jgi:acyl carrier protein